MKIRYIARSSESSLVLKHLDAHYKISYKTLFIRTESIKIITVDSLIGKYYQEKNKVFIKMEC
jgi:hypothetical protein